MHELFVVLFLSISTICLRSYPSPEQVSNLSSHFSISCHKIIASSFPCPVSDEILDLSKLFFLDLVKAEFLVNLVKESYHLTIVRISSANTVSHGNVLHVVSLLLAHSTLLHHKIVDWELLMDLCDLLLVFEILFQGEAHHLILGLFMLLEQLV